MVSTPRRLSHGGFSILAAIMAAILAGILPAIAPRRAAIRPRRTRTVLRMACPPCVAACAPTMILHSPCATAGELILRQSRSAGNKTTAPVAGRGFFHNGSQGDMQNRHAGCTMPEADTEGQRFAAGTPQAAPGFFLKGSHQLDWGMK